MTNNESDQRETSAGQVSDAVQAAWGNETGAPLPLVDSDHDTVSSQTDYGVCHAFHQAPFPTSR